MQVRGHNQIDAIVVYVLFHCAGYGPHALETNFLSWICPEKSTLKLVILSSLAAKCCKVRKVLPCEVSIYVYFGITRGKI